MCGALVLWLRSRNCSLSQAAQTCPLSGIHLLLAWFSDVLGMMGPGEQGPRNVICITAAARHVLASLCQHPRVVAGARVSPGAMGEAGQKWELLRLGMYLTEQLCWGWEGNIPVACFIWKLPSGYPLTFGWVAAWSGWLCFKEIICRFWRSTWLEVAWPVPASKSL